MNKSALRDAILEKLRAELAQQTAAANLARDEAISEESRPENQYDMHSQEAAYLAEGQARLVREIAENLAHYTTLPLPGFAVDSAIALGAVVGLRNTKATNWYFLGPRAGGIAVTIDDRDVLVLTPQSPLGRELLGKHVGEAVTGPGRGGQQQIVAIE